MKRADTGKSDASRLGTTALDRFLADYHFHEVHAVSVLASPDRVFGAVKELTPREVPLLRVLFALRALPAMVTRRAGVPFRGSQPLLEQFLSHGFTLLVEEPDQGLVLGTVGQFWKPLTRPLPLDSPEQFLAFDRPDYAKAVMDFSIVDAPSGTGVVLRTETRVLIPDATARRRFAAYWLLVRPWSGLIRRMWVQAIKRRAERQGE